MAPRQFSSPLLYFMSPRRQASIAEGDVARLESIKKLESFIYSCYSPLDQQNAIVTYLNGTADLLDKEIAHQREYLHGLRELDLPTREGIAYERRETTKAIKRISLERLAVTKSMKGLSADMNEELFVLQACRESTRPGTRDMLSDAYAKSIGAFIDMYDLVPPRVHYHNDFEQKTLDFYEGKLCIKKIDLCWCQLAGCFRMDETNVAIPLVPHGLSNSSLEWIFGSDESITRRSAKNALLLSKSMAPALEKGHIAIIPIAGNGGSPTRWRYLLPSSDKRNNSMYAQSSKNTKRYFEVEHQELRFRNDSRPSSRFMYFRFLLNLMQDKWRRRGGDIEEVDLNDEVTSAWGMPGRYMRKSALVGLLKNVCGIVLHERLLEATTFDDDEQDATTSQNSFLEAQVALEMRRILGIRKETGRESKRESP